MNQQQAARKLGSVLREFLPPGEPQLAVIHQHVYHLRVGEQAYLIKWVAAENKRGQNELRIGRLFARRAGLPAPRLLFEKPVNGGVIAGWEWIEGHDLRQRGRERLPEVFAALGQLHRALRNTGEVVSPLSEQRFATIREMLAAETYRLSAPFPARTREQCAAIMTRLEAGYPTLIHGDMHPGNVLLSGGQVWFVDWSYACNSLNLLDLDYIHSLALPGEEPSWPVIRPQEAAAVLRDYFRAAGLDGLDVFATHRAVMAWNLLRTYENSIQNGYRAEAETVREQLIGVLERD